MDKSCPRTLLTLIAIAVATSGIAADLKSPKSWFQADSDKPQAPGSVIAVWSPALLQRADGTRARGFGGRLIFYGTKDHTPIRVDGALVVYAYDEDNQNGQNSRPDRKYIFTREQFVSHYSKGDLGHSYSIWIPWDHVEMTTKRISLVARFNPVEGSPVVSEVAKGTLDGSNSSPIENAPQWTTPPSQAGMASVRSVSHETTTPTEPQPPARSGEDSPQMATATIRIPARGQSR